jgi:hypothetical protein
MRQLLDKLRDYLVEAQAEILPKSPEGGRYATR